jgi:pimeloyl-ACP methyl ester carboxylesterase
MRHLGPLLVRQIQQRGPQLIAMAWHDPSRLSPETIALYQKPLQVENWDRALWEFTLASRNSGLAERLSQLILPVLVITGDDDRIVPTQDSIRLAGELPNARLVIIPQAGHVPHEERPDLFTQATNEFITSLP